MVRSSSLLEKIIGMLGLLLLGFSILERTTALGTSLYSLHILIGLIMMILLLVDWWRAQSTSKLVFIGAAILMMMFWLFAVFEDLGILGDYPVFVVISIGAALGLIGFLIARKKSIHTDQRNRSGSSDTSS